MPTRSHFVGRFEQGADVAFEGAEVDRRPELEINIAFSFEQFVGDVDGVLQVEHDKPLFDHEAVHLVSPKWKLILEAEFGEIICAMRLISMARFDSTELNDLVVRGAEAFREMIEHQSAAQGLWKGGNQQTVVAPGN